MHVLEYLHRNVKTVAMPSAMVAGALLCRPVTALEAWTHQMITPSLIFLMLFVTFCRVKPSQMKPSMLHVWLLLFQVVVSAALYFALLPLDAIVAQGAMICVLAPVAMAAVVIAGMLGANVPTMATYSLLCNMAIALIAPVVLSLAGTGACSFTQILARIAPLLIMPFAAAQFCRFLLPKTAKWIGRGSPRNPCRLLAFSHIRTAFPQSCVTAPQCVHSAYPTCTWAGGHDARDGALRIQSSCHGAGTSPDRDSDPRSPGPASETPA